MELTFSKELPKAEGQYLIHWNSWKNYELITVIRIPPKFEWGVEWPEYLAITEWRNRSVEKINMDYVIGISNKLP